jgi:hypothetical protein
VTVEAGSTFLLPCSYTISSFTDRTGAPGIINCFAPTSLTLTASPETICAGESATLTALADNAVAYSLDGTNWQPETDFNETPTSTTAYTLYAKTAEGCVATKANAAAVTVNPIPDAPTMGGESNSYCTSGTITATFGNGGTGIRWTDDNTTASPRTVAASGIYYAVTTSDEGCESSAVSVSVTIVPPGGQGQQNTCGCATGLSNCKGICTAYGCNNPSTCVSFTEVSIGPYEGSGKVDWDAANKLCSQKGAGWRLPNSAVEACCLSNPTSPLPGGVTNDKYWTSYTDTPWGAFRWHPGHGDCDFNRYYRTEPYYVRCVR